MISRSFLTTGAVVVVANVIVALVGVASLRLYTELAPSQVFGAANLLLGVAGLGSSIFVMPIINTQIRYQTEAARAGQADDFAGEVLRWALASAALVAILVAFGLSVAGAVYCGPAMIAATVAWLLGSTVRGVFMTRLHAEQRMKTYTASRTCEAILAALATSAALALAPQPQSYVWGQAVGPLVVVGVFSLVAPWPTWRLARPRASAIGFLEKVRRYGAPFVPLALLGWLANLADRYVLAAFLGAGATGQYLAAFTIASSAFLLTNGVMGDLFRPKLFDAENAGDRVRARRVFLAWLIAYGAISLCGLAAFAVLSHWIVGFILAEGYRHGAEEIVMWVALGYAIYGLTIAFENRILSLGNSLRLVWPVAVGAAGNIVLSCLFVPWYGAVGAARAACGGFALQCAITSVTLWLTLRESASRFPEG